MRVVHVGAVLPHGELVLERCARLDRRLVHPRNAVHGIGKDHPMPVHGSWFRQTVLDVDSNAITFYRFDGRPRRGAVVAPAVDLQAIGEFAHHRLSDQVEGLEAILPSPGERGAVGGDHRRVAIDAGGRAGLSLRCQQVAGADQAGCAGSGCCDTGKQDFSSRDHRSSY